MQTSKLNLCVITIIFLVFFSTAINSQEKTVLVIESYHKEFYWDKSYRKGIIETIGNKATLEFFEMDTKRLPISKHISRAKAAIAKIDTLQPDIIMLGDDNALRLVGKAVLSREIPLVFLGINGNPRDYFNGRAPDGISGVLERPLLKRDLLLVREINPNWKNILVLFDDSVTARIYRDSPFFFSGNNHKKILGLNVEIFLSNSYEELKSKIKQAQINKDVLFLGGLNSLKDRHNQYVDSHTAVKWINRHSEIPMFGFWKGTVGRQGAIGGYVIDGFSMGAQAARQVTTLLEGGSSRDLNIEWQNEGRLVLSPSALIRWNITMPLELKNKAQYQD